MASTYVKAPCVRIFLLTLELDDVEAARLIGDIDQPVDRKKHENGSL